MRFRTAIGTFGATMPSLDMISFGPTLRSPHSPDERCLHVAAVSIDGTNGSYTVNLEGENTVDSDFNGLWQIKAGETNVTVNETVNE